MFKISILHRYLVKELSRTFLPSLFCFEFVLLLGFSIQLLHKGLDVPSVFSVMPYMILYTLPHALPTSLLTATVMTYGKLSADNEITAIRIAGIHLHNIVTPIVITGVFFSIITLYLNAEVLPRSYFKVRQLQEKAVKRVLATHLITAKKKIDFNPYQIYIGNIENSIFKDIAVFEYADEYIVNILLAEEGEVEIDDAGNKVLLTLRRGEFLRPDMKDSVEAPTTGSFEEAIFQIPLKRRVRHTSLKYTTLTSLVAQRREINKKLSSSAESFKDPEGTIKVARKKISSVKEEKNKVLQRQSNAEAGIKNSKSNISKQEGAIERAKFNIAISKNYIRVAKGNIEKLTKEKEEGLAKNISLIDKNILLIEKVIEKESRKIKGAKRKILISQGLVGKKKKNIEEIKLELERIELSKQGLEKKHSALSERIELAGKQKLKRELSINIHKRLSPSLASLSFILIGIPLGIMTRSNNMLISLGISFILILFIYYPLFAAGLVVADSLNFPIIPSIWSANVVNLILSVVLFKKVLNR
ncbi:MAG: LptF/LptG family permease [Candidatus Brocadiaceae bacterium]|nr:LptF/LptG family permease [Candidatus Brocadiaceae bacterium]